TAPLRITSPPLTPPAKTGIMSSGRNATSAHRLVNPAEPSLPSSTSKVLTRVSSSKPRVPSRRSELMTSAVNRQAPQLSRKAALTSPLRRPGPRGGERPQGPRPQQLGQAKQHARQRNGEAHPVRRPAPRPHPQLALND